MSKEKKIKASDWLISSSEVKTEKKGGDDSKSPDFFDLKNKGDSAVVTFLDKDPNEPGWEKPPAVKYHKIWQMKDGEKWFTLALCRESLGETCPICERNKTLEEDDRTNSPALNEFAYTVLVQNEDEDGELYPASKQIRMTNEAQHDRLIEKSLAVEKSNDIGLKELTGLRGNSWTVERPDKDFVPRIGWIENLRAIPDLESLHNSPEPFTLDELIDKFNTSLEDMEAYVARMGSESEGSFKRPIINKD